MNDLDFEKRDLLMVAGSVFFVLGLSPFLGIAASAVIGVAIFFGVKLFVKKKRDLMLRNIGGGICADCGSTLTNHKCPKCNHTK